MAPLVVSRDCPRARALVRNHCRAACAPLIGATTASASPWITSVGMGRARLPIDSYADRANGSGLGTPCCITPNACMTVRAAVWTSPEWRASAAYRSGYAAATSEAIAAPAETPARKTCRGSPPCSATTCVVIPAMIDGSPASRCWCAGSYQFQHFLGFCVAGCSGKSTIHPRAPATSCRRVPRARSSASCVQPCSMTTSGRPVGGAAPSGRYST